MVGVWFIPEERIEIEWKSRLQEERGGKFMMKREKSKIIRNCTYETEIDVQLYKSIDDENDDEKW